MPFASKAQMRKFYATPSLHKYIPEYSAATDYKHLPERAPGSRKRHRKHHGSVLRQLARSGR